MSEKAERILLIVVLADLALVGVVGYAIEKNREPLGILFLTSGGPVAFNHQAHVRHGGPGLDCRDCHHDMPGGEATEMNCRACHYYGREPHRCVSEKIHQRCIGAKCVSCHADRGCEYCHNH